METKNKRKLYLLISASIITFLIIIYFLLGNKGASDSAVEEFSVSFIKDYSTYSMSSTEEYNIKLDKYISNEYLAEFQDRFFLQKQNFVSKEKKGNKSNFENASCKITTYEYPPKTYSADCEYTATILDYPDINIETSKKERVRLGIIKINNDFKITSLSFSD